PVFYGGLVARIVVPVYVVFLSVECVHHVVSRGLLAGVVGSYATMLGRRVRIAVLHLLLDLVSGITAGAGASNGREYLAASTADPVAEQSADDRANGSPSQTMLVFRLLGVGHLLVVAILPRGASHFGQRLDAYHLGAARLCDHPITCERTCGRYSRRTYRKPDDQRLVHPVSPLTI